MLDINGLNIFYGKLQALWDVSLRIDEKEIMAVLGSNASGKTTLLKAISGLLRLASGRVEFLGGRIDKMPAYRIAKLGISHIPEGGGIFPDMKVRENLELGAYGQKEEGKKKETIKWVYQIFPALKAREGQVARTLSGGERQMLAIARGLMSRPRLCMFDEPSYGLAPILVGEFFKVIRDLREQGVTILLVEQNVKHTLEIADRAYLLENGKVVLEGTSGRFLQDSYVRQAYLGL